MKSAQLFHQLRRVAWIQIILGLSLLFGLFSVIAPGPAYAAGNPAPVQVFYVTLPEADALTVLNAINSAAVSPVTTYFSIAVGVTGTYIYYDQWENGDDFDIANPGNLFSSGNPGGTQIWGSSLARRTAAHPTRLAERRRRPHQRYRDERPRLPECLDGFHQRQRRHTPRSRRQLYQDRRLRYLLFLLGAYRPEPGGEHRHDNAQCHRAARGHGASGA